MSLSRDSISLCSAAAALDGLLSSMFSFFVCETVYAIAEEEHCNKNVELEKKIGSALPAFKGETYVFMDPVFQEAELHPT